MGGLGPKFACIGRGSGPKLAPLGAYVDGLGSRSGPKLVVLKPNQSVLEAIRAKTDPNPSGNAIRQSDQGEKWPKTERDKGPVRLARLARIARLAGLARLAGMDRNALEPSPNFLKRYYTYTH